MALARDVLKHRHIDGLQGWMYYERMRYRCHECRSNYFPLDRELNLPKGRISKQKQSQLASLSARLTYREAKKVYEELTGLAVGRMTAHRTVQHLGGNISSPKAPKPKKHVKEKKEADKTHITGDGVMVHFKEEGWKEVKVGAVYEVDAKRKAGNIMYTATPENWERFGDALYTLAGKPDVDETRSMTFVSDAARWLSDLQELLFPLATRIVDFWHVTEYLWDVANHFYGEGSDKAKEWAHEKVKQLKEGKQKLIQRSLSHMKPKTKKQREILKNTQTYFTNHGHEMDYPRYEQMGLHIGSGIAEASCKHVIQSRFKRTGMRWSRKGCNNLLNLRLAQLNNRWDEVLDSMKN